MLSSFLILAISQDYHQMITRPVGISADSAFHPILFLIMRKNDNNNSHCHGHFWLDDKPGKKPPIP